MKTVKLLNDYLKENAIVTIAKNNGDIIYTGKVKDLRHETVKETQVINLFGMGNSNDIIITIE